MLKQDRVRALGLMSGTSLDGIDAAEIVTDGHEVFEVLGTAYRPYTDSERAVLRAALGKWQDDDVAQVSALIDTLHADLAAQFPDADLVGFHGQTLAHDPGGRGTHQAGDGAALAQALGKPVVWDFRSADVMMGGQGAPLAPFYHFALAKKMQADGPLAILNLGGVGNLTWIDPALPHPDSDGALLAFDTGPANAPINDLMQSRLGLASDQDGALAATGQVDDGIVAAFLRHPYFFRMPPKSLDRDAFADLTGAVADLSDADAAATLTAACARSVAQALALCPSTPRQLLVAGGGRRNPTMMSMIAKSCEVPVGPIEDAGFDGDFLEAQAFAFLAVRTAKGLATSAPGTTGVAAAIGGGTLSRPS
ncbi:anhydro-N-acetylmuramic acid kinase [Pseudooctadecabacter sp.]|uniref:anhydro-N-acetylmuramic acid kinase n=1 Tax=Pseudooctadecabacter sp. TaxID=1966338 RepID=UPI0025CF1A62|nr:anhydro-N-acetylmuramic acid kinase [Pseudooctadecabacter sp.]